MCDFEKAFIKAVNDNNKLVEVKCCFFHLTKNIKDHVKSILATVEKAKGQKSKEFEMAQRTKRRVMMLPLLPEELITPRTVKLIRAAWKEACPDRRKAFKPLFKTLLETYVGKQRKGSDAVTPHAFHHHSGA